MIPYIYVFIRTDLTIAQQIVQAAHATHVSGKEYGNPENCHLVLCQVDSESSLLSVSKELKLRELNHITFYEVDPDSSGSPIGYTAICTEPISKKGFLGKYPLYNR